MAKHYDKHFKLDAVQCYHDHRELGLIGYAANLGLNHHPLKLAPQNEPTKNMLFFKVNAQQQVSSKIMSRLSLVLVISSFESHVVDGDQVHILKKLGRKNTTDSYMRIYWKH